MKKDNPSIRKDLNGALIDAFTLEELTDELKYHGIVDIVTDIQTRSSTFSDVVYAVIDYCERRGTLVRLINILYRVRPSNLLLDKFIEDYQSIIDGICKPIEENVIGPIEENVIERILQYLGESQVVIRKEGLLIPSFGLMSILALLFWIFDPSFNGEPRQVSPTPTNPRLPPGDTVYECSEEFLEKNQHGPVSAIIKVESGWLYGSNGGLKLFKKQGGSDFDDKITLDSVRTVTIDNKERVWIGFSCHGLAFAKFEQGKWRVIEHLNDENMLKGVTITAIEIDEESDTIYVGFNGFNSPNTSDNVVLSYAKIDENKAIGNWEWEYISLPNRFANIDQPFHTTTVALTRGGEKVWIGNAWFGLDYYFDRTLNLEHLDEDLSIKSMSVSRIGTLWAGTSSGLYILPEDGKWISSSELEGRPVDMVVDLSHVMHTLGENATLIKTQHELHLCSHKKGQVDASCEPITLDVDIGNISHLHPTQTLIAIGYDDGKWDDSIPISNLSQIVESQN